MSRVRIGVAALRLVFFTPLFVRSITDSTSSQWLYIGPAVCIAVGIALIYPKRWTR